MPPSPCTKEGLERACEAHWNLFAARKWADCPEDWKPHYRARMLEVFKLWEGSQDDPPVAP